MCRKNVLTILAVAILALSASAGAAAFTVTRSIQEEFDDVEEYLNTVGTGEYTQGSGWLDSSELEVGSEDSGLNWQVCAVQYDQLGIPQGATIRSAKLTFTVDNSGNTGTSNDFTILAEATDDASVFSWHDEGGWAGLDPC